MTRVPIRIRLALAFAIVMVVVLGATGLFVYLRLSDDIDRTIERELSARLAGVVSIVRDDGDDLGDPVQDPLAGTADEAFIQVLDGGGEIAGANVPELEQEPILSAGEVEALLSGEPASVERDPPGLGEALRLKAAPASDDGESYTAVVGTSLEERDETLASLRRLLLIGGPLALLAASLAGYGVAAGALRPVYHMRRRAAAISASDPGHRLPVPPARDEVAALGGTLNDMLERLEEAFRRERAFVADASHELRTPLSILRTELELALRRGRSPEELRDSLRSAAVETDKLIRLAENLLTIARADEGRLPAELARTDLGELLASVVARFAGRANELGRSMEVAAPDGVSLMGDEPRLQQALGNMVENALVHGTGTVTLGAVQTDRRVQLHVMDEGPGFPPGFLSDAFERFSRANAARGRDGAGLGLAIVDAVARAHGGSAHASNERDGANVWLSLPSEGQGPDGEPRSDRSEASGASVPAPSP